MQTALRPLAGATRWARGLETDCFWRGLLRIVCQRLSVHIFYRGKKHIRETVGPFSFFTSNYKFCF